MTKPIPYLYNGKTLTFVYNNVQTILDRSSANFAPTIDALKKGLWDKVVELANLRKVLPLLSNGRVRIFDDGNIYLDDAIIRNSLCERMFAMLSEGFNVTPLIRFLENWSQNPSEESKVDMYSFIETNNLPITEDGCFLAYKIVTKDYKDCRTNTINNAVGANVTMPREQVDPDRHSTCSRGLHACSAEYLPHYGSQDDDDRVVVVKINPKNVVAVPVDYANAKMRVCEYDVVGENLEWGDRIKPNFTSEYAKDDVIPTKSIYEDHDEEEEDEEDENEEYEDGELDTLLDTLTAESVSNSEVPAEKVEQIRLIRKMLAEGFTKKAISDQTGVSPRQIGRIGTGEAWANIK